MTPTISNPNLNKIVLVQTCEDIAGSVKTLYGSSTISYKPGSDNT